MRAGDFAAHRCMPLTAAPKSPAAQQCLAALPVPAHAASAPSPPQLKLPRFRFENFTTANGLPDNHVFAVLVDGDRIWAGTENGLAALRERNGRPTRPRTAWRIAPCFRWL